MLLDAVLPVMVVVDCGAADEKVLGVILVVAVAVAVDCDVVE